MAEKSHSDGGRVPPQDITAEKSLLGAILLSDSSFPEVLEHIKYQDFYDKNHALIFKAMTELFDKNKPIDLLTLSSEMRAEKTLKKVGGEPYLSILTNFVPTASHIKAYIDLVEQASVRRKLIKAGTEIVEKAYEDDVEVEELVGRAEKDLFEVSDKATKNDYSGMGDLLIKALDRLEELQKNKGALRGLKTGFPDLDKKTAGFQKGDLIILGARPGMGKTALALDLAYNAAKINKKDVLFFSMEMSESEITDRLISVASHVKSWNIRTGNLTNEDFAKIGEATGEIGEAPLYIDDTSLLTALQMRNKARRFAHDHDIGMVVIDYLQLIRGSDRYAGNRVQEVTEISRNLKSLARELEVPVIALSQLSRGVTGREDQRPTLTDLRESGSIEQDADLVMLLHREDYYKKDRVEDYVPTHIAELNFAKHRHGALGTIELYFDEEYVHFLSVDRTHTE